MYKQLVTPNLDPIVYQYGKALNDWYGWCLAVAWTSFGGKTTNPTAWDAWSNSVSSRHQDSNLPGGVYVPIWFSGAGGAGHVAIYKDGAVWSSPYSHKPYMDILNSIAQVESYYKVKYVGWSEDIGSVKVVESVAETNPGGNNDMAEKVTVDTARILAHGVLARNGLRGRGYALDGSTDADKSFVGKDLSNAFVQELFLSAEARQWRDTNDDNSVNGINARLDQLPAAESERDALKGVNQNLSSVNVSLTEKIDKLKGDNADLTNSAASLQKENEALKSQQPDTTEPLSLSELIGAIFKKLTGRK